MNTGNIGRLSLASGSRLHLVKPFGFEITDAKLKRAGLDYWQHVDLHTYESVDEFLDMHSDKKMAFFSSHGEKDYTSIEFEDEMFLIFGKESTGLPEELKSKYLDLQYKIPIFSERVRSLNLANAVSIVVYQGLNVIRL